MAKVGQIIETTIDRFDGGIVNDHHDTQENTSRMTSNFDIVTNPHRLTPYHDTEDGHSAASTFRPRNYALALRTGTTYAIYALGVQSGASDAEIQYKALTTGSSNDLDDNGWSTTAANTQTTGATFDEELFVWYPKTQLIYGARTGTHIWTYEPNGGGFSDSAQALTYTNIAQGLVHSQDDILYIPYDNKVLSNNNGSYNTTAATVPTHFVITSICEYGNFLAIGAAPLSGIGNSRVFLWNRDASVTTFSESIDWGEGSLRILEVVDGVLIGISQIGGAGAGPPTFSSGFFTDRVIFRVYDQSKGAVQFRELQGGTATTQVRIPKQKIDNQLFFTMLIELDGVVRSGVWSIGRHNINSPFALTLETPPNNNTALTTGDQTPAFIIVGDYTFITSVASSTWAVQKTDNTANYTANSVYESKKYNSGDSSLKKDLIGFTVMTEFLPSAGQIIAEYAIDENIGQASWTNILTETTNDSISASDVAGLPKDYKEIAFRIESTGNAEITGFSWKEKITGKRAYD